MQVIVESIVLYYERKLKEQGYNIVIGVDEAGRGPLAGPVVAAAVTLLTAGFKNRIDDSKKLTLLERENAFPEILKKSIFGIGIINEKIIDRLNIFAATHLAMEEAVFSLLAKLKSAGEKSIHVIVDGKNMDLNINLPITSIIGGDAKSKSIACASILAKVVRDRIMDLYHKIYPEYGFNLHKGYGTVLHKTALNKFGPSIIHRLSFKYV